MLRRDKRTKGGGADIPSVSPRDSSIPPVSGAKIPIGFLVFLGLVIRAQGGVAWTVGDTPSGLWASGAAMVKPYFSPLPYFPWWFRYIWGGQVP